MRLHHCMDTVDLHMVCRLFYCVCLTFSDFVHADNFNDCFLVMYTVCNAV